MNKFFIGTIFISNFLFSSIAQANVCNRTAQVVAEIERQIGKKCQDITGDDLLKIKEMDLADKSIKSLTTNSFQGLGSLESISLLNNQLTNLPDNIFQGLGLLISINLFNNRLKKLPDNLFQGLSSLHFLSLNNNLLTSLPDKIFQGLISLTDLYLQNNQLTSLPENLFQGLSSLEYIWLDYNKLNSLPDNIFNGLNSLRYLYINGNPNDLTQTPAYQQFQIIRICFNVFANFPDINITNHFNLIDGLVNYHQNITQIEEFIPKAEAFIKWESFIRGTPISYQYYSLYDLIPHADNVGQINIVRELAVDVCALAPSFCPIREEIHQFPMRYHLEATIALKNELINSQAPASTIAKVQELINGLQDFFAMKLDYLKLKPSLPLESIAQLDLLFLNTNPSLNQIADSILNLHNLINAYSKNKEWMSKYALTTLKVKSYLQLKFKEQFWSLADDDKMEIAIALTKVSEATALLTPAESKSIQKLLQQGSLTKAIQRSIEWQLAKLSREYEANLATLSESDTVRRKNFFDTYNYQVRTSIIAEWDKLNE
ncbi:MAG: leucine-rich repeat domain-containing protein [Bacteriovoracaceae bacterium]